MRVSTPIRLGSLELKNRWVLAPMTTYSSQLDGVVSPDELPYFRSRAKAGFGLVISPACYVHPSGHAFDGQWACSGPEFLDSLRAAADAIHDGGAKAALQIHHGGRQCPGRLCGGVPWCASEIPSERPGAETPRAMTYCEIDEIVASFAAACNLAEQAGWDAIEIHGANTYLLQQFVSPHSNRRWDDYSSDRLRFSREVIRACRAACALPIGYRLSPEEAETPGIRLSGTRALVEMLIEEGMAWIDVSLRDFRQPSLFDPESGPMLRMISEWVAGRVPLMGGGGIKSLEDAEACLELGCEFTYVGRAAVVEPDFVRKAEASEEMRASVPSVDAARILTLPKGLESKIYAVPGWFPVENSSGI